MKSTDSKKRLGKYFTPPSVAQFVVWSAFKQFLQKQFPKKLLKKSYLKDFEWKNYKNLFSVSRHTQIKEKIDKSKILDLGVGDGAFLLAVCKFLDNFYFRRNITGLNSSRLNLFKDRIYGVDYSHQSVGKCRGRIRKWILEGTKPNQGSKLNKIIDQALNNQIKVGNVLIGDIYPNDQKLEFYTLKNDDQLANEKELFHWYKKFPKVFNNKKQGFDLVLCNPPYVTKYISPDDISLYRRLYQKKLFINRLNLYHLFLARVYDLLTQRGISVFLTSNSILTDNYSLKIRDYLLSKFSMKQIIDFVSRTRIFPNVLQGTCILVMAKKNGVSELQTQVTRTYDIKSLIQGDISKEKIPTHRLVYFNKIIPSPYPKTSQILEFLRKNCILLKDQYKIQSGEIRPADKNIRPYYFKKIPQNLNKSDFDIILNGKNIQPYCINLIEDRQKPRWYKRPIEKEKRIFRERHSVLPRIVFQRITAREQLMRVVAAKIDKNHLDIFKRIWVENNANYLLVDDYLASSHLISTETLLGIFNSFLINWYMHQINLTAAIPPTDLGLIPLPKKESIKGYQSDSIHTKVSKLRYLLEKCSSSSEMFTHLCPFCPSNGKISILQSEINLQIFQLYGLSEDFQSEIIKQLSIHHQYFNHH